MLWMKLQSAAVYLVLGAVLSYLSGAVCANLPDPAPRQWQTEQGLFPWPDRAPGGWPTRAETIYTFRAPGRATRLIESHSFELRPTAGEFTIMAGPRLYEWSMRLHDAGYPLTCVRRRELQTNTGRLSPASIMDRGLTFRAMGREFTLPLRILPIGFATNTIAFAAALRALRGVPSITSRYVRRIRRRCVVCGYPRSGNCPECGRDYVARPDRSLVVRIQAASALAGPRMTTAALAFTLSGLTALSIRAAAGAPLAVHAWTGQAGFGYTGAAGGDEFWEVRVHREPIRVCILAPIGYRWSSEPVAANAQAAPPDPAVASKWQFLLRRIPHRLNLIQPDGAVQIVWPWVVFDLAIITGATSLLAVIGLAVVRIRRARCADGIREPL